MLSLLFDIVVIIVKHSGHRGFRFNVAQALLPIVFSVIFYVLIRKQIKISIPH